MKNLMYINDGPDYSKDPFVKYPHAYIHGVCTLSSLDKHCLVSRYLPWPIELGQYGDGTVTDEALFAWAKNLGGDVNMQSAMPCRGKLGPCVRLTYTLPAARLPMPSHAVA